MSFMHKYGINEIRELLNKHYENKYNVISYVGSKQPIEISCNEHGNFKIRLDHIKDKLNEELCPICRKEKIRQEKYELFLKNTKDIHRR